MGAKNLLSVTTRLPPIQPFTNKILSPMRPEEPAPPTRSEVTSAPPKPVSQRQLTTPYVFPPFRIRGFRAEVRRGDPATRELRFAPCRPEVRGSGPVGRLRGFQPGVGIGVGGGVGPAIYTNWIFFWMECDQPPPPPPTPFSIRPAPRLPARVPSPSMRHCAPLLTVRHPPPQCLPSLTVMGVHMQGCGREG